MMRLYQHLHKKKRSEQMLNKQTRKLRKVGDSMTGSIPPSLLRQIGWADGDELQLEVVDQTIQLKKEDSHIKQDQRSKNEAS